MRRSLAMLLCTVLMSSISCTSSRQSLSEIRTVNRAPLWEQLAPLATQAEYGKDRAARLAAAKTGRTLADTCVQQHPREPGCYYYRAVLTGLYYGMTIMGYQSGLTQMVADCERLITIDPAFADAGAYRILGQIYTQIPETAFRPDSLTRDLAKARAYLEHAVARAPQHVENHLALCDTLLALEAWTTARTHCGQAERLLPAQHAHPAYTTWRRSLGEAKKRLAQQGRSSLTTDATNQ